MELEKLMSMTLPELEHAGVKGMKWGVRKSEESDPHVKKLADNAKKIDTALTTNRDSKVANSAYADNERELRKKKLIRNVAIGVGVGAAVGVGVLAYKNRGLIKSEIFDMQYDSRTNYRRKLTDKELKKIMSDDKPLTFAKGKVFTRISNINESGIGESSRIYVSHKQEDVDRYVSMLSKTSNNFRHGESMYEIPIRSTKEFKAASSKETFNSFVNIMKDTSSGNRPLRESMVKHLSIMEGSSDIFKIPNNAAEAESFAKDHFKTFAKGMFFDVDANKAYFNHMLEQGYDAIPDFNDKGRLAKSPLIIINTKDIVYEAATALTDADRSNADKRLKLILKHSEELEHAGVKGMKWGVRKERDKVAKKAAKTEVKLEKREAKAQKYDAKVAEAAGTRLDLEKKRATETSRFKRMSMDEEILKLQVYESDQADNASRVRDGKLTKGQRNALILGAAVAAYGAYKLVDSGHAGQIVKSLSGNTDWKTNPALSAKMDADGLFNNVVSRINPGYGAPGTTNNCRRCTFAYEMSRRGFDVDATKTLAGTGQTVFGEEAALGRKIKGGTLGGMLKVSMEKKSFEKDGTPMSDLTKKVLMGKGLGENTFWEKSGPGDTLTSVDVFSKLMRQPDGSRGEISVRWLQGGAHSIAYEIVDKKPVIFDTQTNRIFKTASDFDFYMERIKEAGFTRLDDKELDTEFLQRWLKSK